MERIYTKDYFLSKLKSGDIYITFNTFDYKNVYGYYLYEDNQKILIWTRFGKKLYNGLVEAVNDDLLNLGFIFIKIKYPTDCNLYMLNDSNFELIPKILLKVMFKKRLNVANPTFNKN